MATGLKKIRGKRILIFDDETQGERKIPPSLPLPK
jgi:hypothetical protein